MEATEMEARIRRVAALFPESESHVVFKKIDSVMRGNPGREIMAAAEAFACDLAIITPAFPEMGRHVINARLHVQGDSAWEPLDVHGLLRTQGLEDCTHVAPGLIAAAIRKGAKYISLDTSCDDDLKVIVEEGLRSGRRVLWAGSGGLASALADALFQGSIPRTERPSGGNRPVLFCIGSDHPVTTAQVTALKAHRSTTSTDVQAALLRGEHAVLQISRGMTGQCIFNLLRDIKPLLGGMLLSGGDTASMVCQAVGARSIEIENQIVMGLPSGVLRGGHLDGLRVATKSGGFGEVNALIQVADFFTCPKN